MIPVTGVLLTMYCRLYAGSAIEAWNIFLPSYLLFWRYQPTRLVLVFDAESDADVAYGALFAALPPHPSIYFEMPPPLPFVAYETRPIGYTRQLQRRRTCVRVH